MLKARCVIKTRHYNPGNIVEVPSIDHPFIVSGNFIIVEEKPAIKLSKKKKRR